MDVKDLVQAKENSATVAYQSFVLLTDLKPNDLFCFFENKDAPYYHLRIKTHFTGDFHYIKCGNKKSVIKTFDLIEGQEEYKKYKKAYFVDRDFDESIKNHHRSLYETPCYSIENLYCSDNSVEELIKTNFQISIEMPEYEKVANLYRTLKNDFLQASLLFNAWYKAQKKKSDKLAIPSNVNLTDTLIPGFIQLHLTSVDKNYDMDTILQKYPNSVAVAEDELELELESLAQSDLLFNLRGKYIFNFMTSFIRLLLLDGADEAKQTILTRKIKYNMDNSMALTLLSGFAKTPSCLIDFLKQYNEN